MAVHFYHHTQDVPSSTWTINHGLGVRPIVSVKVIDNGAMTEILPSNITHPTAMQTVITFTSPRTGEARLA